MRILSIAVVSLLVLSCQQSPILPLPDNNDELRAQPNAALIDKQGAMDVLINKAGRQRMLSQRIAKCYFMLGMNISSKEAQEQLTKAITLFKEQHELLKINSISSGFAEQLQATEKLWNKYEAIILSKVERNSAEKVLEMSQELLALCEKNVTSLCEYTNSLPNNIGNKLTNAEMSKIINQSGRQRMLSQKLSLYYLAYIWDVKADESSEQIPALLNEFSTNLNELQGFKLNSEELKKQYLSLMADWRAIATSCLTLETQNRETAVAFLQNTEKITNTMNKVTSLYEKEFEIDSEALSGQGRK